MNCKTCNYALWNLPARTCPECGTPFKPSEFEFRTSAVRFCCPHCMQAYYGTGDRGQLVPREFVCVKCARPVDMDQMIVLPTQGVDERDTQPNYINWVDRSKCGFFKAYFVTLGRTLGTPKRAIEAASPSSSLAAAWWFSTLTDLFVVAVSAGAMALMMLLMFVSMGTGGGGPGPGGALGVFGCVGGFILAFIVIAQIWGLLHALTAHLVLAISGPTEHGLGRTMQAAFYASGPRIVCAVPCISFYILPIAVIWSTVSLILMLIPAQRVSVLRGIMAGLLLPAIAFVLAVAGFAWLAIGIPSMGPAGGGGSWATGPGGASTITGPSGGSVSGADMAKMNMMLSAVREKMATGGLRHAAELIVERRVMPYDFVLSGGLTPTPSRSIVGATTLDQIPFKRPSEQKQIIDNAIGVLPLDASAYQVAGIIFTHIGVDLATADSGVWLFVTEPVSGWGAPTGAGAPSWVRIVGRADGTTDVIPSSTFAAKLAEQNTLRAAGGLPIFSPGSFPMPPTGAKPMPIDGEEEP